MTNVDIQEGSYHFLESQMVYCGNEFVLHNLGLIVFHSKKGEMEAFGTADIKTKNLDLYPGVRDIRVSFEHKGSVLQIVDAYIFDFDLNPASGHMSVEIMGKIEIPASDNTGSARAETEDPKRIFTEKGERTIHGFTKKRSDSKEAKNNPFIEIRHMSKIGRIKLALTANKMVREILSRDPEREVQTAVLKNSQITAMEIARMASSKIIDGEVIRMILKNSAWVKNYAVKVALVKNPKTPIKDSMRFLGFLRNIELKEVARSRSIPDPVIMGAKKILCTRRK